MADVTIHSVVEGWAGSQKCQRVILTAGSTSDTVPPKMIGLKEIEAVEPTRRIGTLDGRYGAVASVVTATVTSYTPSSDVLEAAAAKIECFFYGY